ncbi:MAG TPA: RtcB family protein [Bacteroidales bacterium]|nr:RtcB family protein [Bacteroidales bacterium]HOK74192.1 RtcB family protein [Bacteroidales bacterium]HOM39997.1 RtcB family protein [Bacteroidales bacterium]HPP92200.1 RtcB family protein [Bacteroidales bacterium]HQG56231.1 RtcB family protein [Bacteroidales bacterium]
MVKKIETDGLDVLLWTDDIEPGAYRQILNLARHPYARKHIAIMPDCHEGFGMPIGGVLATSEVIIPNAVGVDIGCGMSAVKTSLTGINKNDLKKIMSDIRELIPLGFKHHKKSQGHDKMPDPTKLGFDPFELPVVSREYDSALHQVGTLGGGNHFIEIQKGDDGAIWIMIHSGSRNIGKQVADYYNKKAISLNREAGEDYGPKTELAWLRLDSKIGQDYLKEMQYCIEFAMCNRYLMMDRIIGVFNDYFGSKFSHGEIINIAHNYAAIEKHFGEELVIHRKGATKATKGLKGIIPGSQGTRSYIVEGKGNPDSFESCSHGAGRVMGRNQAIRTLNLEEEKRRLDKLDILHSIRTKNDLEEAPSAYKNIEEVMAQQADLVDVVTGLSPLAVIKG